MSTGKFALPPRISNRRQFLRAANNGKKIVAAGVICQALAHPDNPTMRVGFTATKRIGGAVQRNRVRRRLREIVRLYFSPNAPKTYDYVFIGRNTTLTRDFDGLRKDIRFILHRLTEPENAASLSLPDTVCDADSSNQS